MKEGGDEVRLKKWWGGERLRKQAVGNVVEEKEETKTERERRKANLKRKHDSNAAKCSELKIEHVCFFSFEWQKNKE